MKKEWKDFVKELPFETLFLHKDEFQIQFPRFKEVQLPVILQRKEDNIHVLMSALELQLSKNQSELMQQLQQKLSH